MNIYFINKQSKLKGPFDINNASRTQILRIGDICIRDTEDGLLFLLIVNNTNRWNSCKCIDKARYAETIFNGNTLLFSFNGIEKRIGKVEHLEWLSKIFTSEITRDFFSNAIDILTYKCDFWDIEIFVRIHSMSPITTIRGETDIIDINPKIIHPSYPLFYSYLNEEMRVAFTTISEGNNSLREIYEYLRGKYSAEFRKAIKKFLEDNPQATIYDKSL